MMKYFILINGEVKGPYPVDKLLSEGVVEDTLACKDDGQELWQKAINYKELRALFGASGQAGESVANCFYFSAVNRHNDVGFFMDHNKTSHKEQDSIYKLELSESDPEEATFGIVADNSKFAINYRSYIIEPCCISTNLYKEGFTRIKHEDYGTAYLLEGKWIVIEKAKIRYE